MRLICAVVLALALCGCQPTSQSPPFGKPVATTLIVFSADWCSPCQKAKPLVDQIEKSGVKIVRYDINEDRQMVEQYQISRVPAFILIQGRKVSRTNSIQAVLKALNATS